MSSGSINVSEDDRILLFVLRLNDMIIFHILYIHMESLCTWVCIYAIYMHVCILYFL
jgi:hypothetical protein